MGNLLYLAMAVGLSTLGVCVLWLVRHRPRSMQSRIDAFSRELQALAPPDARAKRPEVQLGGVRPTPARPRSHAATLSAMERVDAGAGARGRSRDAQRSAESRAPRNEE